MLRVSRDELPRLRILRAETSKPFYLPGEDARIDVSVTTPDGEPVKGAEVRVEAEEGTLFQIEINFEPNQASFPPTSTPATSRKR